MPTAAPSHGEPVELDHGGGETRRQRDIGADRQIETGGQDHQSEAGRHEEEQARLAQHVEDIVDGEKGVAERTTTPRRSVPTASQAIERLNQVAAT